MTIRLDNRGSKTKKRHGRTKPTFDLKRDEAKWNSCLGVGAGTCIKDEMNEDDSYVDIVAS